MADKLSWTELRKALASRAGVSEKKAGVFLGALQAQLVEALKTEKQVKINGLGTFRVQAVAPRKSVNVQTGEEIVIEGYNKLAFTPEAGVKELVESNQKSEVSIQNSEIDPIQKLGAQAEEIVDILGELGQSPKAPIVEQETEPEPVVEEPIVEPEESESIGINPNQSEPIGETIPEPEPEPVAVPEPEPEYEPIIVHEPVKKKKKSHFWRDTLICMLVLIAMLAAGYFFLRQELSDIIRSYIKPTQTEQVAEQPKVVAQEAEEPVVDETDAEKELIPEGELSQDEILAEFLAASEDEEEVQEEEKQEEEQGGLLATEAIREGSRLTWMSKRYYGSKVYWPYIYDANRDVISNPSHIDVGTPIRIPRLTQAQLDTTTTAFKQLREEAEAACKK